MEGGFVLQALHDAIHDEVRVLCVSEDHTAQ